MEERGGVSELNVGSSFTRTPATLVLKDVTVAADESLELLPPFVPPAVPDPDAIIFEVKGLRFPTSIQPPRIWF